MSFPESSLPFAAVGAVPRVVVEALIHRRELASLELREARAHGVKTAVIAGLSGALLLLTGIAGTFAVAAAVWNREDRGMILALVAAAYLVGAAALAFLAAHRLKSWRPFAETREQFQEDCSCVHDILTSNSK